MSRPLFAGSCKSRGWLSANEKEDKNASNDKTIYLRLWGDNRPFSPGRFVVPLQTT